MRHRKKFNHLGRKAGHRKALLANMASSLILHKRITTTTAKAKALRMYIEPLITKTKDLTTQAESSNAQRIVFSYLQNKYAVKVLFQEVGPKVLDRPGGYTRILKTGTRLGDNADMCIIELVDFNENLLSAKEESKKATRRSRRSKKNSSTKGDKTAVEIANAENSTAEQDKIEELNKKKDDNTKESGTKVSSTSGEESTEDGDKSIEEKID